MCDDKTKAKTKEREGSNDGGIGSDRRDARVKNGRRQGQRERREAA